MVLKLVSTSYRVLFIPRFFFNAVGLSARLEEEKRGRPGDDVRDQLELGRARIGHVDAEQLTAGGRGGSPEVDVVAPGREPVGVR